MQSHLGCRFRFGRTAWTASLLMVMICFCTTQTLLADVDARRELAKVQAEYARYLQEEQDFTARTQQHMNSAIETLLGTWGTAALTQKFKEDGAAAASVTQELYNLKKFVAAGLEGDNREQADILINQIASNILERIARDGADAVGQVPGVIDTVFHLLYLREDIQQRAILDAQRNDLENLQRYWTDYAAGHPWPLLPPVAQSTTLVSSRDAEFQRAISRLGIRITTPGQAEKDGTAQIVASASQGFSVTDVDIINTSQDWLALDFNGAYLIPVNASSHSQRLGLVSSIDADRVSKKVHGDHPFMRLEPQPYLVHASFNGSSVPGKVFTQQHWVILAPQAAAKMRFHSVCLDHNLGTPGQGELFYVSDRPLPTRVQSILRAASLRNEVPQNYVWQAIEEEHIKWWDPRFGPEVMLAQARQRFDSSQFDSAAQLSADVLAQDPRNGAAALIAGESYYHLGLASFDSQHAVKMYSDSQRQLMQALDAGETVNIPIMHHHSSGLDQDLCAGYVTISKNTFGFHSAQEPAHSFEVPIAKIYELRFEGEKAGRLHTKIGLQRGKKEAKQTYNFHSAEVKLVRETVMIGTSPFSSNGIACSVACGPSMDVVYQLLLRVTASK
jgi:hypothetical protein